VNLPSSVAGQNIVLRWRLGSDSSNGTAGWRIDNVQITGPTSTGITYGWSSNPSGFTSSLQNTTANPVVNTAYILTVSANGCSTTATTTQVAVTQDNAVTATTSASSVCQGTVVTLTGTGGPGTWSSNTSSFTSTSAVVTDIPAITTIYDYHVVASSGCVYDVFVPVTVNPLPNPAVVNSGPVCEGSAFELSAASGLSNYVWTGPNGFTYSGHDTIIDVSSLAMAGVYTVTVTEGTHGCVNTGTTTQVIYQNPTVTATVDPALVCPNGSATFTGSAMDGLDREDSAVILACFLTLCQYLMRETIHSLHMTVVFATAV
jgi:hypothetical protein